MNIGLIIAGGSGNRMGQDIPKQFMHVDGAPIIIWTLKAFEQHPDIDAIAVVCLNGWDTVLQSYANQFMVKKLRWIFPGGSTGMESIHNGIYGLKEAGCNDEDLVLIHDAVRPSGLARNLSDYLCLIAGGHALNVIPKSHGHLEAWTDRLQVFHVVIECPAKKIARI